ncbi:MAG: precorrin-8X methylmutase [Clostridiales bacterium]|nr:precorrin-8X methylmutase [Clostridiales bacterium]
MDWHYLSPREIERRSFEIISERLGDTSIPPAHYPVLMRVLHTTADFDYVQNLYFSQDAVQAGLDALKLGAHIVTDTHMAQAGVNKAALARLGGDTHCFMSDPQIAAIAESRGITRAAVCMEKAAALPGPLIVAVGNAPTALLRLHELIGENKIDPALIIGVPVGFVNVMESKEIIKSGATPCIIAEGLKGGSTVAAAIVNALLYEV